MNTSGAGGGGGKNSAPRVTPDNLFSKDTVEVVLALCEGPIAGLVFDAKSFYLDGTPLVSQVGTRNFDPFELHLYHGALPATPITNILGGFSSSQNVATVLATGAGVTRTTPAGNRNTVDQLQVRLAIGQLYLTNAKGDQLDNTIQFNIEYKQSSSGTWLPFFSTATISLTGKTTSGEIKEYVKGVPRIAGDWDIRVTLVSSTSITYSVLSLSWDSYQLITVGPKEYDNLAVIRGYGQSSDQFSSIPTFSGVYATKVINVPTNFDPKTRTYSTTGAGTSGGAWDGTFKQAHTDSLFWCWYDMMNSSLYGMKYHWPYLNVDRYSVYTAAQYADAFVVLPGLGYQPRFTFNESFEQSKNALELMYFLPGIAGAVPVTDMNGTVTLKIDAPGSYVQVFAPESATIEGFQYQFSDVATRYNDINVMFTNPNLGWQPDYRRVYDSTLITANGRIPFQMEAVGCLDPNEACRRAYRLLLQANTETCTVSFQTARMGLGLQIFDLIALADPDMRWGRGARIRSYKPSSKIITFRDPVLLGAVATSGTALVQTPSGVYSYAMTYNALTPNQVTITGTWPSDVPTNAQVVLTGSDFGSVQMFRILSIVPDDNNPELMTITAAQHNPAKFTSADSYDPGTGVVHAPALQAFPTAPTIKSISSGDADSFLSSDGTVSNRMRIEVAFVPQAQVVDYTFYVSVVGERTEQKISSPNTSAYLPFVTPGTSYNVQATTSFPDGSSSARSAISTHTVAARALAPATPTGLTVTVSSGALSLNWVVNIEVDLKQYDIYETLAGATTNPTLLTVPTYSVTANTWSKPGLSDSVTYNYWIRSVNRSGLVSAWTARSSVTTPAFGLVSILSTWRNGADNTKIEGGAVAANTLTANKLSIGSRNVVLNGITFDYDVSTNTVTWSAGSAQYVNDAGTAVITAIAANATGVVWTTGTVFIYWVKDASTLSTTNSVAVAWGVNNLVAAVYKGSSLLDSNYGRTVIDGSNIKTGTIDASNIRAGSLSADDIRSGTMNARNLEVTDLLKISTGTGALAVGKTSAYDLTTDGVYFGRTAEAGGTFGFGLAAGRKVSGVDQYIQMNSQSGLKLVNATHFVTGAAAAASTDVTTSQTITLLTGMDLLSLSILGAGGGGGVSGTNGGNTIVQLWNGAVNTGISWTSTGGTGYSASGSMGQSSSLGTGGNPGSNASGYGAGGGGITGVLYRGSYTTNPEAAGLASSLIQIDAYSITAYANPKLVITIGSGGLGSSGAGSGSPGIVKYTAQAISLIPANVIPLQPTYTGTISKTSGGLLTFPSLGAGFWIISAQGNNLLLDYVQTHASGKQVRLVQGNFASFISDITPLDLATSTTAVTYDYQFFKLGAWV